MTSSSSPQKRKSGLCCVGGAPEETGNKDAQQGDVPPQLQSPSRSNSVLRVASKAANNPYDATLLKKLGEKYYYSLPALKDPRVSRLPYSIRILLESALRNYGGARW
eukprot:g12260.t1